MKVVKTNFRMACTHTHTHTHTHTQHAEITTPSCFWLIIFKNKELRYHLTQGRIPAKRPFYDPLHDNHYRVVFGSFSGITTPFTTLYDPLYDPPKMGPKGVKGLFVIRDIRILPIYHAINLH